MFKVTVKVKLIHFLLLMHKSKNRFLIFLGLFFLKLNCFFFLFQASVIRTKSCEHLPYPIILSTFAVSCQWFVYGYLLGDPFIQTPNLIGCVLSAFQLSLFLIYKGKSSDQIRLVWQFPETTNLFRKYTATVSSIRLTFYYSDWSVHKRIDL